MKYYSFELTMPNNNSWNGHWSGENDKYVKVRSMTEKNFKKSTIDILGNHYYNFGDGWGANVYVKEIDKSENGKIKRKNYLFCGYDWMIESIINYGEILNSIQVKKIHIEEVERKRLMSVSNLALTTMGL